MLSKKAITTLAGCLLAASAGIASAQNAWPAKPVTMVVPFPPGGSTDVLARLFAAKLGESLGQSIVIENKSGANTSVGASAVARAQPDGYTLMITGAPTFTTNSLLYSNLGYHPVDSYEYIAIAGTAPFVILTNNSSGIEKVEDIVGKSQKDPLSFGSFGTASTPHLAGEYLGQRTGAKMLHVPYRGSAPAMTDLIGGQIPLSIDTLVAGLPQVRAGKAKAVALTGPEPSALLPGVPTVAASGVEGYDFQTWYGIVAPRGTPQPVVDKLAGEIRKMLEDEGVRTQMRELGFEPGYSDGAAFRARVDSEMKRNAEVIKAAGIKVE